MQELFDTHYPSLEMEIMGVNEFGFEGNNAGFCEGRDIPWLQDVDSDGNGISDVWYDSWDIDYRDVVIVDEANNEMARYNVTTFDLTSPENFETLRDMFIEEAVVPPETEWQSPVEKLDVDNNGFVAARDALLVINHTQDYPGGVLPPLNGAEPEFYYDTSGDGILAARDAILVINHLIRVNLSNSPSLIAPTPGDADTGLETVGVDLVAHQGAEQLSDATPTSMASLSDSVEPTRLPSAGQTTPEAWEYDGVARSNDVERSDNATVSTRVVDAAFADLR